MVLRYVAGRYKKPTNAQTKGLKGSNVAQNDPKKVLMTFHAFLGQFFFKVGVYGSSIFANPSKMVPGCVACGYI